MTTTGTGAFEAMLAHHAALADGVDRRVAAVASAVEEGVGYEIAVSELLAYAASEVLPHALAEERTIYRAAAEREDLAGTVAEMVDEHRRLAASLERLARADDGHGADDEARALGALFTAHVTRENEVVLPPLRDDRESNLAALLTEMHRLTEIGLAVEEDGVDFTHVTHAGPDTESELVRLFLAAAYSLAAAGKGDRACLLAGEAWAAVRAGRPDLAARVTASLHQLARQVVAEPITLSPTSRTSTASTASPTSTASTAPAAPVAHAALVAHASAAADDGSRQRGSDATLDVRSLTPARRHEAIFATFAALGQGGGFVLVNDHDPKPLRYQFEAEHRGEFSWDVLEAGPRVWRVRIGREKSGCR